MAVSFAAKYGKEMGINNDARYVPFTSHVPFGKVVSATPNGRVAWFPLADGSSPSHGADTMVPPPSCSPTTTRRTTVCAPALPV